MGFVNPKAFGDSITSVTGYVPQGGRDNFYFGGSNNASTFPMTTGTGSAVNTTLGTKVAARLSAGTTATGTFPPVSRAPFDTTKATITFEFKLANQAALTYVNETTYRMQYGTNGFNNTTNRGWGLYIDGTGHWILAIAANGTITNTQGPGNALGTPGVFQHHVISINETQHQWWVDGVLVATIPIGWPINDTSGSTLTTSFARSSTSPGSNDFMTELQISYAA